MNLYGIPPLITGFLILSLGIIIYLKDKKAKPHIIFSLFCFSMFWWLFNFSLMYFSKTPEQALFWAKTGFLFVIFIPILAYHFVITLLHAHEEWVTKIFYTLSIPLLLVTYSSLIYTKVNFNFWGFYPQAGPLYLLCMGLFTFCFGRCIWLLKDTPQYKTIQWAFFFGLTGIFDYIDKYYVVVYPFGYLSALIFITLIAYAIVRYRFLDIEIVIRKSVIYTILISIITIFYSISIYLTTNFLQQRFGIKSFIWASLWASLLAILFIPLRNIIQSWTEKYLFKASVAEISDQNDMLRQEITQTEKFKAVALITSSIVHEIKNPLTAINTFIELLPEKKNDPEFIKKFNAIVPHEINRINHLLQEMLLFAKPTPPEFQNINPINVIESVLLLTQDQCYKQNIKVIKNSQTTNNLRIQADPNQLKQALLNLILNAIDAMPKGGTLSITTTSENILTISIQDTGCGIDPKDLPRIFEPFFTKKEKGTGLGLAITQGIVEKHGGKISVESNLNHGTKFVLTFNKK